MQTGLFIEWIESWAQELRHENRKIQLLVDNFDGHLVSPDRPSTNIQLNVLSPDLKSHVQPLEAGIIARFSMLLSIGIHQLCD